MRGAGVGWGYLQGFVVGAIRHYEWMPPASEQFTWDHRDVDFSQATDNEAGRKQERQRKRSRTAALGDMPTHVRYEGNRAAHQEALVRGGADLRSVEPPLLVVR